MWMQSAPITRARGGGTRPASVQGNGNSSDFVNINWSHTFNSHLFNQTGANVIRPDGANLTQTATEGIPYVNVNNLRDSVMGVLETSLSRPPTAGAM